MSGNLFPQSWRKNRAGIFPFSREGRRGKLAGAKMEEKKRGNEEEKTEDRRSDSQLLSALCSTLSAFPNDY